MCLVYFLSTSSFSSIMMCLTFQLFFEIQSSALSLSLHHIGLADGLFELFGETHDFALETLVGLLESSDLLAKCEGVSTLVSQRRSATRSLE